MTDIPFFKKIAIPSLGIFRRGPNRVAGIDIGSYSTKVVQLKYEGERALLETYGELLNAGYVKSSEDRGGFLRYPESDIIELLKDLRRESQVSAQDFVFSIPATSSFVTTLSLPGIEKAELEKTIQFEARRYIPVPISEVVLEWETLDSVANGDSLNVLLLAVPRDVIEKFKRIAAALDINLLALEIEIFSMLRSLVGYDTTPTAILNIGHHATTVVLIDQARIRMSHTFNKGSGELTTALERGLNLSRERADTLKRDIGLSEKVEEKETASIIMPLFDLWVSETERAISIYNRRAPRKIQKLILAGGGASLKGIIDVLSNKLGLEAMRGAPFSRVTIPPILGQTLRDIGPSFATAVGLALKEMSGK